jgi:hypothetical protein
MQNKNKRKNRSSQCRFVARQNYQSAFDTLFLIHCKNNSDPKSGIKMITTIQRNQFKDKQKDIKILLQTSRSKKRDLSSRKLLLLLLHLSRSFFRIFFGVTEPTSSSTPCENERERPTMLIFCCHLSKITCFRWVQTGLIW